MMIMIMRRIRMRMSRDDYDEVITMKTMKTILSQLISAQVIHSLSPTPAAAALPSTPTAPRSIITRSTTAS